MKLVSEVRICTKCKTEKPLTTDFFHKAKTNPQGLNTVCKDCKREYAKAYTEANRIKVAERRRKYRKNNQDKIKRGKRKHYLENREKILASNKKHYEKNVEMYRSYNHKREARLADLPNTLTMSEWAETKKSFNGSCAYCGKSEEQHQAKFKQNLHQDHFTPLSAGGGYTKDNILPSCLTCNLSKQDYNFFEWYPQQEHYSIEREQKITEILGVNYDYI